MPSSDTDVTTAVRASRIGIPAAMRAPNTASSSTSVSGIDVHSDCRKSWPSRALATRSVLALPASLTRRSGCEAWILRTTARSVSTVVSACEFGPATVKVTRAAFPSLVTSPFPLLVEGARMSAAACGSAARASLTSRATFRISTAEVAARCRSPDLASIRTLSLGGVTTPSWVSTCSPRPAWPGSYCWTGVPVANCPAMKAATMNASQAPTAAFRCRALQQASRSTRGRWPRADGRAAGEAGLGSKRMVALWLGC
jgi:hypothetical protein